MRVKKIQLKEFKRFDDLTIDLGDNPRKIIALVGPNGCGKSSIFDSFEEKQKDYRNYGSEEAQFFYKAYFYTDETKKNTSYDKNNSIQITTDSATGGLNRKSFYIRTCQKI